jgi:hypothetical protein
MLALLEANPHVAAAKLMMRHLRVLGSRTAGMKTPLPTIDFRFTRRTNASFPRGRLAPRPVRDGASAPSCLLTNRCICEFEDLPFSRETGGPIGDPRPRS